MELARGANHAQNNALNARTLIIAEHAKPDLHSLMENASAQHAIKENMVPFLNAYHVHPIVKIVTPTLNAQYAMMDSHY
jgi:hypothetical protein